jgi:hypothetical protein
MFAFFHLRLSGLPGLLPTAFILGYAAWRTGSLYASVLVHFGLNAPGAIHTLLQITNGIGLPFLGLPAAAVGLAATLLLLYAIRRWQPAPAQPAPVKPSPRASWLRDYAPLAGAGLVYLAIVGYTLVTSLTTGLITLEQAGYNTVSVEQVLESRFRITNQAGDAVGQMACTITPQGQDLRLACASQVSDYDITTPTGHFKDAAHTAAWSATYAVTGMDLLAYSYERTYPTGSSFRATLMDGRLIVDDGAGVQELPVTPDVLVEYEWAWRTNALRPQWFTTIQAPYVDLAV